MQVKDDARERILEAARKTLAEHGYDADIRVIAAQASIGTTSIYRRWTNKEELVREIAKAMVEEATVRLTEIRRTVADAKDAIRATNQFGFEMVRKYGLLATVTVARRQPREYQDVFAGSELDRYYGHLVKLGIQQGHFDPDLDVRYAVHAWRALVSPDAVRNIVSERSVAEIAELTSSYLIRAMSRNGS